MAATIKDIAKKVGVNPSTVSRVINGTASISDETKRKIKEAMLEMDYHPNSNARSLVNGSTFTIGLVINAQNSDAFSNTYFIRSVSAIEATAQEKGFNLLICSDRVQQNDNAVKNLILEKKVDGIILPVSIITDELINLLVENSFPFVIMGEPDIIRQEMFWVDMDNKQGGQEAVDHLFKRGYKYPVLFVESRGTMFERNRIQGFRNAMERHGVECNSKNIVECGIEGESIKYAIEQILEIGSKIDSIICTNNAVAYHVLRELKIREKRVPDDFGIVTFDNYPLAEYMEPPLSVVDVDTYKLGEEAAKALFSIIKEPAIRERNVLVPTKMIERKSTEKGE